MQADQAALQENSENTNQIIFCFSRDYDVSSNKTPSIKKEYFELIQKKMYFLKQEDQQDYISTKAFEEDKINETNIFHSMQVQQVCSLHMKNHTRTKKT